MNWQDVLEINRTALSGLVAVMLGMLPEGRTIARMAKRRVLELLLPSEACLRRLIVILTRKMEAPTIRERAAGSTSRGKKNAERIPAFALFDPRRLVGIVKTKYPRFGPNIRHFDEEAPPPRPALPTDEDELDAASLRRRIAAMQNALDDLPGQAQRLMRIIARRKRDGKPKVKPMRPGRPPGHRYRGKRPVDEMLAGLNYLALWVLEEPPPDWVVAD